MVGHVQQSMPAHLKKYRGGNTYIPQHAQAEMAQHLENSLPPHMKQYAGAYMQQNVIAPSLARRSAVRAPVAPPDSSAVPHAPVVQPELQQNVPEQAAGAVVRPDTAVQPSTPSQNPVVGGPQASYAVSVSQNQSPDQSYAFIDNPVKAPKQSPLAALPGSSSIIVRIGLIAGGLIVLVIIFAVLRGLLSNTPDLTSFVTVAQEQQELIHLVTNAGQQDGLTASNQNLAATMQASLTSSQGATITYLTTNHKKVSEKQLGLKVSAATDTQLTDAAAAGTYNQTFHDVMQTKLNAYGSTLSTAYKQNPGPKGQALLKDNYQQAQLFQTQLGALAN
jgi:hypothetical protein